MLWNEIVSIVLVLEGYKGSTGKVGKVKRGGLVEGKLIAEVHVLTVKQIDTIGNMGD